MTSGRFLGNIKVNYACQRQIQVKFTEQQEPRYKNKARIVHCTVVVLCLFAVFITAS